MCDSSFTDYDSSSDECYSPAPLRLRTTLPRCQGVNLLRPSLYSADSGQGSSSTVNSTDKPVDPFDEKDEVVYENLVKPPLDTSGLYGQLLRSTVNQIGDKKKQEKLVEDVLALLTEKAPWAPKEQIVSSGVNFVESQLRKMSERRPTEYKRTAEALCTLLNKAKQERPSRFATIRRSFRRIVGKK